MTSLLKFCPRCGEKLPGKKRGEEKYRCRNCGFSLSEIVAEFDKYPSIPETNFEVEDKQELMKKVAQDYQDKAAKIDWLDGLTLWFKDGWVNIRPSHTQPLLRLNIEADDKKILEERKKEFIKLFISLGGKQFSE